MAKLAKDDKEIESLKVRRLTFFWGGFEKFLSFMGEPTEPTNWLMIYLLESWLIILILCKFV